MLGSFFLSNCKISPQNTCFAGSTIHSLHLSGQMVYIMTNSLMSTRYTFSQKITQAPEVVWLRAIQSIESNKKLVLYLILK